MSQRRGAQLGLVAGFLVLVGSVVTLIVGSFTASNDVAATQRGSTAQTLASSNLPIIISKH